MGDIGPTRQHYEVLPLRAPAEPARREPAVEPEPSQPIRSAERVPVIRR